MKKYFVALALVSALTVGSVPLKASAEAERINMLSSKSDWSVWEDNKSVLTLTDGVMSVTPTDTDAGATYVAAGYKNATIEFDYRISYDPEVDPYNEEDGNMLPGSFWGILFGNELIVDENWAAINVLPWQGTGGYPYMLCFDTERQLTDSESPRWSQVGLTLRRYKALGGHDYAARWSTVDPGDFDYVVSTGSTAYSMTPDFSSPVKVSDCFDTQKHSVKLDYSARYVSSGAEKDAILINVWFDGELVLTVTDEMPFKGENWGIETDVDKRNGEGYVSVFAHHASVSDARLYDWKVDISALTIADAGEVGGGTTSESSSESNAHSAGGSSSGGVSGGTSDDGKTEKGCGSAIAICTGGAFFAAIAALLMRKRRGQS